MELFKEKGKKNIIRIPYGYSKKIANVLGLSQNTITKVAKGINKSPTTRMKVVSLLEKLLTEDLNNSKF